MTPRARLVSLAAIVSGLVIACGGGAGGGGNGSGGPPPGGGGSFACSDSAVAKNNVALVCDFAVTGTNQWQIKAMVGPPTDATDITGFAFDVVFDPTRLRYVGGSISAGSLLYRNGGIPLLTAGVDPLQPGRLVIGMHLPGDTKAVGADSTFNVIVMFRLEAVPGTSFEVEMPKFENAQALDANDQPIASITFSNQLTLAMH